MFQDYTLVIGDAHVSPEQDLARFTALGNFIAAEQPKTIIQIGDFGTFDSVSTHEDRATVKGSKMPSVKQDFNSCKAALKLLHIPIIQEQQRLIDAKRKRYKPRFVLCMGNHEERVKKFINRNPALKDFIDVPKEMGFYSENVVGNNKWEIVNYKDYLDHEDFLYTHVPHNARGPITGVNSGRIIASVAKQGLIYGHTHKFNVEPFPLLGNENKCLFVINTGCFLPNDQVEEYAMGQTTGWSYGVCLIKSNGKFKTPSIFFLTVNELIEKYGS